MKKIILTLGIFAVGLSTFAMNSNTKLEEEVTCFKHTEVYNCEGHLVAVLTEPC